MKAKLLGIALAFASTAAFAQANLAGAYIGGSLGQSRTSFSASNFSAGSALVSESQDKTDTAWKAFVGYNFTRNWAVELGYADLGEPEYKYSGTGALAGFNGRARVENSAWFLAGKGTLPIANNFAAFGKVGLSRNKSEATASTNSAALDALLGTPSSASKSKTRVLWGLGAEYAFNRNIGLRLEYEDFGKFGASNTTGETKTRLWSVGLTYAF